MEMKKSLMANFIVRNALATLGMRKSTDSNSRNFTPYFRYRIGQYQPDYYLYFSKGPTARQYKNEIANKLIYEYEGYSLIQYLDFHYNAYHFKPLDLSYFG
jgi:hypothetical protein